MPPGLTTENGPKRCGPRRAGSRRLARCLGTGAACLLVLLSLASGTEPARGSETDVPHRRGRLVVDGDLSDWRAGTMVHFGRPEVPRTTSAAEVRLAWDRERLWVAFGIHDTTPAPAPAGVAGATLFQWDSVEVYIDALGDRTQRMGTDDFQIIVSSDGRTAVLQGDPLLAEVEAMSVPKRERPGVVLETAARAESGGYVIEAALPLSGVGIAPREGLEIAVDLALNDWTEPHDPLPMFAYRMSTLGALADKPRAAVLEPQYNPSGLAGEPADAFERAHYRPWAWSGSGDFGHPATWHRVRLVGGPGLAERLSGTWGAESLAVVATLVGLAGAGLVTLARELRHRRRISALLGRLARMEEASPGAEPAPIALFPRDRQEIHAVETLRDRLAVTLNATERSAAPSNALPLAVRAVAAARARLAEPLSPAELARTLFVSLRTLQRALSDSLDCSPREMIIAVKMEAARALLQDGLARVQDVARAVGFDDPAHFTRRFKAYFGRAPVAMAGRRTGSGAA